MKKISHLFCILFISLSLAGVIFMQPLASYAATIDPSFKFSTIETGHFVIHFHQGLDRTANKAASISEEMHAELSPLFKWSPAEKTQIVLIDNMDFANGAATVLPYNAMYIFVVPPLSDMTIGEYDNWLKLVLLHEYVHILTMDTVNGYSAVTRKIFGKTLPGYDPLSLLLFLVTAPPNVLMPDWWLEGIATWAETEFTSSGRGRSSYVEMIFRMAVLEDNIPKVDQINGDVPYWPSGKMPYIYGMLLEKYIAEIKGRETLSELSASHSKRLPFLISAPAERLTGSHYAKLYDDMVSELKAGQLEKIKGLNTQPVTEYNKIPVQGEQVTNPRISPDGRYLAANRNDPHFHEEIVVIDAETHEEIATIRRFPSDHSISWAPDSSHLYFTQAELKNSYNLYQDIYSYNIETRSIKRLTKNIRAKDVDVSPDGKRIVFVKVEAGSQNIALLTNETGDIEVLARMEDVSLSSPTWSADGRFIVFSKHNGSGQTSLELLNTDSKSSETLTISDHDNLAPVWSPDGKFIIYSSDRTGVYNLFAYSLADKEIYQITHLLGGAFQPDVSRDSGKIIFSGYSSKGFYIADMPFDPSKWSKTFSPEIGPSWNNIKRADIEKVKVETPSPLISEQEDYCPRKTLMPRFWLPTLAFDHDGAVFGAFTAGQDVLGYHTYMLQGGIGVSGRGYYNIDYIYDRWYPTLFMNLHSLPAVYSEFFHDDENYYERQRAVTAGISIPLYSTLETELRLMAGYKYEKVKHLSDVYNRRIDTLEVYEGRKDNVFIGLGYSDALKFPYSISKEEGRNVSLIYRRYDKDLANGLDRNELAFDYDEYIGLKRHHVIYLNMKGAWSDGDLIAQQAYQLGGAPATSNEYSIRGFSSAFKTGRHVIKGTLEYRLPIKYILRGWNTKPFFWDRVHMAAFADAGNVWGFHKGFDVSDISAGVGVEARMDMVLGYKLRITPAMGIARGVTDNGETQAYITIYTEL